ncbi:MAG: hypothetical protein HDR43_01050 [Mycoplasma sp.]|nr:hypothetical protein [Mycoplasma sp.]
MKLEIKKTDENKFIAKFSNEELDISANSENWNIEGINKFLIKLATKTPKGETIELEHDKDEENKVYKYIYSLFKEFVDQYNELNA